MSTLTITEEDKKNLYEELIWRSQDWMRRDLIEKKYGREKHDFDWKTQDSMNECIRNWIMTEHFDYFVACMIYYAREERPIGFGSNAMFCVKWKGNSKSNNSPRLYEGNLFETQNAELLDYVKGRLKEDLVKYLPFERYSIIIKDFDKYWEYCEAKSRQINTRMIELNYDFSKWDKLIEQHNINRLLYQKQREFILEHKQNKDSNCIIC